MPDVPAPEDVTEEVEETEEQRSEGYGTGALLGDSLDVADLAVSAAQPVAEAALEAAGSVLEGAVEAAGEAICEVLSGIFES
ncbi:MAG TPA: hypothetical protein VK463_11025 [Desulfomonilaceae bacterium]|nr:hypothetical protein [Desulfomonilaceae bacterium]